jgi:predicted dehydrogenase
MVAAAEAAGVTLMVGQNLRFLPGNVGVRELIASGELGRVWWARSDDWFGMLGAAGTHEWARDAKRAGGGVLHMGGTHHVDLFRFYFGDVGAVRAHCWMDNPLYTNGAEDRAVATLEFESGVVAQFTACYLPYRTPHNFQYVIFGEAGGLYSKLSEDPQGPMSALYQHHAPAVVSSVRGESPEAGFLPVPPVTDGLVGDQPWVNEIAHFASCVRQGTEPISSGRDNVGTMKAVYGCYESARSGREVQLADL